MRYIDIQVGGLMRRRGFRGKWFTCYLHTYAGEADWSRHHRHPWRLAVSLILWGSLQEAYCTSDCVGTVTTTRRAPSLWFYKRRYRHCVKQGKGVSLFLGFGRDQKTSNCATIKTKEGACHYTEVGEG